TWLPLFDDQPTGSIGAIAVAPSDPNIIYVGSGAGIIRPDLATGDGMYKSTDAGRTWTHLGLRETQMIANVAVDPTNPDRLFVAALGHPYGPNSERGIFRSTDGGRTFQKVLYKDDYTSGNDVVIDPRDPNVVYASSMGHVFKPNAERGVFKTTDGGKTWRKVLFVDANTGGVQVVMDPRNASVLYAAMWQAQRVPWKLTSGGAGSGLYKTTDGGAHWTKISKHAGFANGTLGKIGVSVAASNPRIVYAIVQAHDGGVFRSTDAGASWKRVNSEMKLRQRAFYYMAIFADPTNPQVAYAPQVDGVYKTTNGGKTWKTITPPGDHHIIWINPHNPKILLEGNDGGATVSTDGGKTWSSENNQPTGQYYHVALDSQFPFHVYGAAQDEGAFEGPSATANGSIGLGEWHTVALGESTFVAPETGDPNVTYGSGYYSSFARLDDGVGQLHNVSPWPRYMAGASAAETKYRFGWTHPIFFSPANPSELLVAAQNVFSSTDHGQTWKILSPDLTRNDKSTEGPSGGPVDLDQTGAETFPDISSLAVSPRNGDIMWAGSADGLVHVTKDHGVHWTLVTPPALPQWAQISSIEPSHTSESTAYLTASRYQWDDFHPYVYKTTDYGAHWSAMTTGLPEDQYAFVVREDPREPRLLFAGTRSTAYVSLDGGARWQPLSLNLPGMQVRDLAIDPRQGELVAATHGRAFWILDNLALLEQLARQSKYSVTDAQLFAPETAWLSHAYGSGSFPIPDVGRNPRYGATVFFNVPADYDGKTPLELAFLDANGATIRSFALHLKDKHAKKVPPEVREQLDATHQRALDLQETTAIEPGMNAFQWNMRYAPAMDVPGFRTVGTDDFPDTSDGPTITPGTYTVVLQYGANKLTQPLHVQLDPRLHPAAGDLDARLALEMQIHKTLDDLDKAIAAAMAARNRLPAGKREQVDREIDNLVQLNIHSSEADVLHETKLREQIGFLGNSLEAAYERPTAAEYATYDDLRAEAAAGEARLHAIESP
ncbi:MAG: WD40/YVTN/BNR-like repeat-containing protein, partial [Vulcanimicrobiaceae bacterium]